MDRWEAQYSFWSSFGVPAYEENSVPTGAVMPYITYQAVSAPFDGDTSPSASIWTRSTSWLTADTLSDTIEAALRNGGHVIRYREGIVWATAESPFAQNMGEPNDDLVKRKLLSVVLHFA